jgi:myo-inositol 2-dehydrogenase / D-chiro-inositol 1-dehydrogenase
MKTPESQTTCFSPSNRRSFLKSAILTGAAPLILPSFSSAAEPKKKIKLGLIGCGGRGQWIADLFVKHGGYQLVAGADYFQDRLEEFSLRFDVPAKKCYSGLDGYKKLIESGGVDAVAIISPPYFHPEQAEAAVMAGKQVYLAKPIAVDVPGSLSIKESGALATEKGQTFLVDFQTRANEFFVAGVQRVHHGALGKLCFGEAFYHANDPFKNAPDILGPDPENPEARLRVWGVDRTLSGDIITEQNIHTLDVMSWIMNKDPIKATGTCNQKVRPWGNCSDHFSVVYDYGDGVDVSFTSRQFAAHGTKPDGIRNRMFGEDGVLEAQYSGPVLLRGIKESFYRGGDSSGLYQSGAVNNIAAFYWAVMAGDASNETVTPSVQSNLVTILGREAAYTGKTITWEKLLRTKKRLKLDLELKA